MTISNSGLVTDNFASVGESNGTNTVDVTGTSSTWTNGGLVVIGDQANGALTVENGGTVTTGVNGINNVGLVLSNNGSDVTGTVTVDWHRFQSDRGWRDRRYGSRECRYRFANRCQ